MIGIFRPYCRVPQPSACLLSPPKPPIECLQRNCAPATSSSARSRKSSNATGGTLDIPCTCHHPRGVDSTALITLHYHSTPDYHEVNSPDGPIQHRVPFWYRHPFPPIQSRTLSSRPPSTVPREYTRCSLETARTLDRQPRGPSRAPRLSQILSEQPYIIIIEPIHAYLRSFPVRLTVRRGQSPHRPPRPPPRYSQAQPSSSLPQ